MATSTYLVFAEEREVENDLQGLGVGGKDNQIGKASVEGLGRLVGTLLQLYHVTQGVSNWADSVVINSIIRKKESS